MVLPLISANLLNITSYAGDKLTVVAVSNIVVVDVAIICVSLFVFRLLMILYCFIHV